MRPTAKKWIEVDDAIDDALKNVRSVRQDREASKDSLESLIAVLDQLDSPHVLQGKTGDSERSNL